MKFKSFTSLIITFLMVVGLTIGVFAEDIDRDSTTSLDSSNQQDSSTSDSPTELDKDDSSEANENAGDSSDAPSSSSTSSGNGTIDVGVIPESSTVEIQISYPKPPPAASSVPSTPASSTSSNSSESSASEVSTSSETSKVTEAPLEPTVITKGYMGKELGHLVITQDRIKYIPFLVVHDMEFSLTKVYSDTVLAKLNT